MAGIEGQHGLQMAQGVTEGGQAHRVARRRKQAGHGIARVSAVEPVACHEGRRGVELAQALRGLAVHLQPLVRRDLLDQHLAHEVVPKPVARADQHQHARRQRKVQRRKRVHLGVRRQGSGRGGVEGVAGQGHPLQRCQRRIGHVAQTGEDGFGDVAGQALRASGFCTARQFDRGKRVALGHANDVRHILFGQRTRCRLDHEPTGLVVVQGLKIERLHDAAADQARYATAKRRPQRGRARCQHHAHRWTGGGQVHQHIDVGIADQVCVVHQHHDVAAARGGQQQAPERADHLVPPQWTGQGGGRRRERAELGQHRARRCADAVEQGAVRHDQPFGQGGDHRVGASGLCGVHGDDRPAALPGQRSEFTAERGLADTGRAAQHDAAGPFGGGHSQPGHGLGTEQRPSDGGRTRWLQTRDALLVQGFGVAVGRDAELPFERLAQVRVPAHGGRPVAGRELARHQLAVGRFIGGFHPGQAFPLGAGPQQRHEACVQPFACRFGPGFIG